MGSSFADYFRVADEHDPFRDGKQFVGAGGAPRMGGVELAEALALLNQELGLSTPFDLDNVIDTLRLERYAAGSDEGRASLRSSIVKSAYYLLRPMLPVSVRKHLQRLSLRGRTDAAFPRWPVDVTVDQLMALAMLQAIRSSGAESIPFVWFWPDAYKSCLIITHDVETAAGRDYCETLMDIDESYGFRSAFQIVPERRYDVPDSFLDRIRDRGFEVNIHGLNHDGRLFSSWKTFSGRARRISDYGRKFGAKGFRSPVLYRNAEWMSELEFDYDMTFPNVGHLDPQRGGCCTVMPYFIGDMVELPLTTMQDYSLFNILGSFSTDIWKEQIAGIRSYNGLVSFNTHPDYLQDKNALDAYASLLAHLKDCAADGDIWCALPGDVAGWWRYRRSTSLTSSGEMSNTHACAACAYASNDELAWKLVETNDERNSG